MRTVLTVRCAHCYLILVYTIVDQLREAFGKSGLSLLELLAKSGLRIDRTSLARKLGDELPMKTSEAEVIARTLGVTLTWPRKRTRAKAA